MKTAKKYTTIVFNGIYILSLIIFLISTSENIDIKSEFVLHFIENVVTVGALFLLVWNLIMLKGKKLRIISSITFIILFLGLFYNYFDRLWYLSSPWKTQTILYENNHLNIKKIEFQMQDMGALGYNKRIVQVTYLTKYLMIVSEIDTGNVNTLEWSKVNKEINELELKFP